ncbi:hypothetical protein KKG90_07500 [Candidatus Bipolaricaulota bacterium]|nr:hypothetical protein [Candidatus Bipolaricaulota bacterium]
MFTSVAAFAHSASMASKERAGFEATQTIESGGLRIEAFIRRQGSRFIHVEYHVYRNPWTELQEALSGHVELIGEELCGLTLDCDGQSTWVVDLSTNTIVQKPGSQLSEPIPGLSALGELSFLETLPQDFLLRDFGEETNHNRPVRRIGLKPKVGYRSQLLSTVAFPIRKATIDFDTETYFPLDISFTPAAGSPAASVLGPNATIRVSYKDVRILEAQAQSISFSPPSGSRLFEEKPISAADLAEQLPFTLHEELLRRYGFDPADGRAILSKDAENDRSYATIHYSSADEEPQTEATSSSESLSPALTLTVGNYVSRNMARRRSTFSEYGQPMADLALPIRLLNRSELWEKQFPGIDTRYAPVEAFFEKDGAFWFLSGTGMDLDAMESLANDLLQAKNGAQLDHDQLSTP